MSHYAKAILDEVFGADRFLNELVWKRTTAHSSADRYAPIHDTLFYYSKTERRVWNSPRAGYEEAYLDEYYRFDDGDGRLYWRADITGAGVRRGETGAAWRGFDVTAKGRHWAYPPSVLDQMDREGRVYWAKGGSGWPQEKRYREDLDGRAVSDIWDDIDRINPVGSERLGYPTQKPRALLERVIDASSNPDDLVLDCFGGSGTTAAVAENRGRRWITCDLGRFAIHTTRKRMLAVPGVKPFVVQNLGKYERQAWMSAEFEKPEDRAATEAGYRRFILELFHAEPISGHAWLHGTKGGRMVHVGPVDAPITIADVKAIARDVWRAAGAGRSGGATSAAVDVLGWEFAFELNELAREVAAEARVDVKFRRIPREVLEKKAIDQGDIQAKDFFELRALAAKITLKKRVATLALMDFVVDPSDLPEDVARAVKHWSQWIDYWAVDWDFKEDTFHNEWQSYRSRSAPDLDLETRHEYRAAGSYRVVVKVIDLLGNDTTKMLHVEVK